MSETHGPLKPERTATGKRRAANRATLGGDARKDGVLPAKEVTDATFHAATF